MADAVCGPSNPLQQFKQQTQLDRTLQQDRISSRASPAHGFRSADPNVGLLDPEFEAFQAGLPAADLPQYHNHIPPQQHFGGFNAAPAGPSWASDFQRLQISPPAQSQRMHSPALNNWASDFRSQFNTPPQIHTPPPQAFQQQPRFGLTGFQSNFAQPALAPTIQSKGKAPAVEQFDDAAFERAFEQARDNMMGDDQIYHERANISDETLAQSDILKDETLGDEDVFERYRIPEDLGERLNEPLSNIEHTLDKDEQQVNPPTDDDALAATAEELLHKIEHNQTDKFKNSQFLGLMRKLRDREVKVEGDQMVETVSASQSLSTSQPDSAYASGPATPILVDQEQVQPIISKESAPKPQWFDHESTDFDHWESPIR